MKNIMSALSITGHVFYSLVAHFISASRRMLTTDDAGAEEKVSDSQLSLIPQLLVPVTLVIAIPTACMLANKLLVRCKKNNAAVTTTRDERQLATPAEIVELLRDYRYSIKDDRANSLETSLRITGVLIHPLLITLMPLFEEWGFASDQQSLRISNFAIITPYIMATVMLFPITYFSYRLLTGYSSRLRENFLNALCNHPTTMTVAELKKYTDKLGKISEISLSTMGKIVISALTVILPLMLTEKRNYFIVASSITLNVRATQAARGILGHREMRHYRRQYEQIQNFLGLHQAALTHCKEISTYIQVDGNNEILNFTAKDKLFNGLPRCLWFGEMAAFIRDKFSHNPLYVQFEKHVVQLIVLRPSRFSSRVWLSFPGRLAGFKQRIKFIKNFVKDLNQFMSDFFHIENVCSFTCCYDNLAQTKFMLQLSIAHFVEDDQKRVKNILQEHGFSVEMLPGNLSIGPLVTLSPQEIQQILKEFRREFKPIDHKWQSMERNEIRYVHPKEQVFFWKKPLKVFSDRDKKEAEVSQYPKPATQVERPISFEDYGEFVPNDAHCPIKRLPKGAPNTFVMCEEKLLSELKNSSFREGIKWFTSEFDETVEAPPEFSWQTGEQLRDGTVPFLKMRLIGKKGEDNSRKTEERVVSNVCVKAMSPDQKTTYSLYVLNKFPGKLHGKTRTQIKKPEQQERQTIRLRGS